MARNESDREDLMAEAVSLVRRIECLDPTRTRTIVIGFNQLGWLFVYLGSDPMYRFDELGQLRRAFVDGCLYRTSGQTLAKMVRLRRDGSDNGQDVGESILSRRDLSPDELTRFLDRMWFDLSGLCDRFEECLITRQHPVEMTGLPQEIQRGLRTALESRESLAPPIVRRTH